MKASEVMEVLALFIKEHGDMNIHLECMHKLGVSITYEKDNALAMQFYSKKIFISNKKKTKTK